jgi:Ca-activated chloride channel family protein
MVTRRQNGTVSLSAALALVTIVAGGLLAWQVTQVGDFTSLWLTPDQQARRAYEALEFREAWERFEDPEWKGIAAYDSGLYEESAEAFGRIATAAGFYNRGNAFMKSGAYGKAIVAYEQAVADAPEWVEAQENLELATYTLEYIERVREQSDTGDESELSADDYVFDNTKERGLEVEITEQSTIEMESAAKWMRGVDTETRDFLRTRFAGPRNHLVGEQRGAGAVAAGGAGAGGAGVSDRRGSRGAHGNRAGADMVHAAARLPTVRAC